MIFAPIVPVESDLRHPYRTLHKILPLQPSHSASALGPPITGISR
jgi:hypothetical protein